MPEIATTKQPYKQILGGFNILNNKGSKKTVLARYILPNPVLKRGKVHTIATGNVMSN